MKHGFKVMDSDMHIIEPPDLWQRYIDPEFYDGDYADYFRHLRGTKPE